MNEESATSVSPIRVERPEEFVALLTIDRPETRNTISDQEVLAALIAAFLELNADRSVRAIVLTGAGSAFSAGGNLKKMAGEDSVVSTVPMANRDLYRDGIQRLPLALEAIDVPVIAAVNGAAIGAGCDLACMCDIRIAGRSAKFAESFVKVGLIPGDGGAWLLPRVVGFAKASEMALTGAFVSAEEARACGLVSQVVDDAALIEAACAIARQIAANPPQAVRMTRRLLRTAQNSRLENVLELSAALQALAHTTADHNEAVAAFGERRAGRFDGT